MMVPYSNLPYSHNALKVFEAVARKMSFTFAADELNVTQSAVSRQVKQLEDELKTSLVVRKHRAIELTEEGLALFHALQKNYQSLDALIESWRGPKSKRIVIKAALSYATRALLPKVHLLNERYPDYEIAIVPTFDEEESVNSPDYDLLIFTTRLKERYKNKPDITFMREEYMAPVGAEKLLGNDTSLEAILNKPRVHSSLDHHDWNVWLKTAKHSSTKANRNTSFYSLELALSACLSGQGVTVTDLLLILPELKREYLQCPKAVEIQHSDWRYYCHARTQSDVIEDIRLWLEEQTKQELAVLKQLANQNGWRGVIDV